MATTWEQRRGELAHYFDRTASDTWARLTSDAPVSRVRETVRRGRDQMRATLLNWLPADLTGRRILDAGCGTGALAVEAAKRGAHVVAIDVAGSLVAIGRDRAPEGLKIDWHVGDMLDPKLGQFDHVVAMDSLIHYRAGDIVGTLGALADRTSGSMVFTYVPRSVFLTVFLGVGTLFPRSDRSPAVRPVRHGTLTRRMGTSLPDWRIGRDQRVQAGFYTSHALEISRL